MRNDLLRDFRILVVEDEFMLADELQYELEEAGAMVVGPFGNVADAIALIETERPIDGALLDANLGGELVFPVADLLIARGVPIVFTTGYDPSIFPERLKAVRRCEKPISIQAVILAIRQAMRG